MMEVLLSQSAAAMPDLQTVFLVALLLFAGLLFLGVEIFVLPGFGIPGVIGLLLLAGGGAAAWMFLGSCWGSVAVVVTIGLAIALAVTGFRSKALSRRLVLDTQLKQGGGTESQDLKKLVGATGIATSDLRPAGIATVGDSRIDVVSEGGFLEQGTHIRVVAVDGPRVVVAKITE